jgi:hypothetical protein
MLATFLRGAAQKPLTFQYVANAQVSQSGNVRTWSNVAIGQPDRTRLVVVAVHAIRGNATGNRAVGSATIGGISAIIVSGTNVFDTNVSALIYAEVPTGTTATVVVTFVGDAGSDVVGADATIGVYAIYNPKSSAPVDGDRASGSAAPSITLDTDSRGCAIFAGSSGLNGTAIAWSNATEDYEVQEGTNRRRAGASTATSSTTLSVTATFTGANGFLGGASWR